MVWSPKYRYVLVESDQGVFQLRVYDEEGNRTDYHMTLADLPGFMAQDRGKTAGLEDTVNKLELEYDSVNNLQEVKDFFESKRQPVEAKVGELTPASRAVNVTAKVVSKSEIREIPMGRDGSAHRSATR
jgi:hypothetical protein